MDTRNLLESLLDTFPTLTEGEKLVLRTVVAINEERQEQREGGKRQVPPPSKPRSAGRSKRRVRSLEGLRGTPYSLTGREVEVLELLMEGLSSKEIGKVLGISPRTVEVHRGHLMEKMGARSSVQLATIVHRTVLQ